jgi:hypothetical protein
MKKHMKNFNSISGLMDLVLHPPIKISQAWSNSRKWSWGLSLKSHSWFRQMIWSRSWSVNSSLKNYLNLNGIQNNEKI